MKPTRPRTPLRLRGTIFALSLAATATQVGGAAAAPRDAVVSPAVHLSASLLPVLGARELLAALPVRHAPASGNWALLVAGFVGAWAIGRRRVSASGSRSLDPQRPRRR
jgi:hypothetical protein